MSRTVVPSKPRSAKISPAASAIRSRVVSTSLVDMAKPAQALVSNICFNQSYRYRTRSQAASTTKEKEKGWLRSREDSLKCRSYKYLRLFAVTTIRLTAPPEERIQTAGGCGLRRGSRGAIPVANSLAGVRRLQQWERTLEHA